MAQPVKRQKLSLKIKKTTRNVIIDENDHLGDTKEVPSNKRIAFKQRVNDVESDRIKQTRKSPSDKSKELKPHRQKEATTRVAGSSCSSLEKLLKKYRASNLNERQSTSFPLIPLDDDQSDDRRDKQSSLRSQPSVKTFKVRDISYSYHPLPKLCKKCMFRKELPEIPDILQIAVDSVQCATKTSVVNEVNISEKYVNPDQEYIHIVKKTPIKGPSMNHVISCNQPDDLGSTKKLHFYDKSPWNQARNDDILMETLPHVVCTNQEQASTSLANPVTAASLSCCPLCQMDFTSSLSQLDMDGHIAACLATSADDAIW